jgi:hypothetical protein
MVPAVVPLNRVGVVGATAGIDAGISDPDNRHSHYPTQGSMLAEANKDGIKTDKKTV